jgi:RNA polymerase sigma-70 factor (ECF subfamily)
VTAAIACLSCMEQPSDDDAVSGLLRGEHRALRVIVEAHQQAVLRFCRRYTGNAAVAADLTQDVFVTLWEERARYRHGGRLRRYLLGIARHRCLRHLEKHGRLVSLRDDARPTPVRADSAAVTRDLERALAKLEVIHAEVLVLRFLEELSVLEIAEMVGVPEGTVKSRLHRAMAELRKVYP